LKKRTKRRVCPGGHGAANIVSADFLVTPGVLNPVRPVRSSRFRCPLGATIVAVDQTRRSTHGDRYSRRAYIGPRHGVFEGRAEHKTKNEKRRTANDEPPFEKR